jgi:GT2 family glycosyltransferase
MNPVLILTHNCLELTKKCVESVVWQQDIPTDLFIYDNGSTDGTHDWLAKNRAYINPSRDCCYSINCVNSGVSYGWNTCLRFFFEEEQQDHCLVLNNDTILNPSTYRLLLSANVPFVTGASFGDLAEVMKPQTVTLTDGPDFSCFLIRRDCWEKVGAFDETMFNYASDLDFHIRAHRAGIRLMNSHVKFYHERSSTLKNAAPIERRKLCLQADADREALRRKWGCGAGDESYRAMFSDENFGVDSHA